MGASTRTLGLAFLAVIAAFIGSTLWAQRAARGIDADTLTISRDAAPGIEVISAARAEVGRMEALVVRAVEGRGAREDIAVSRRRIDGLFTRALALPNDPEELVLLGRLQSALRAFDETAERVLVQAGSGRSGEARRGVDEALRPLADRAELAASDLVDFDARAAQAAALRIEAARQQNNRLAWQLDALAAVLALGAAYLAWRVNAQSHRVQAAHAELIGRKAEELEQFAGRVAHDVLSPLSAVSMALALAARTAEPQAKEAIVRGAASLRRVTGIVDGLLEFARSGARSEPGVRTEVRPAVLGLQEELAAFAAQQSATLQVGPVPECAVACSAGVLLSLLSNLLRNALKYLGASTTREVQLRVEVRRGRVSFEVEDTGPGIPVEQAERIFEPYVRGAHAGVPGIGLGLATVKKLVVSHGGSCGVRPGARGGALFWFELEEVRTA